MHELIGHKILKIEEAISSGYHGIYRITTESNTFYYSEYIECCNQLSVEWVNIDQLLGEIVTSVEDKELVEEVYDLQDKVMRHINTATDIFGYTIKTTKGWADVIIRNSYGMIHYSGRLDLLIEDPECYRCDENKRCKECERDYELFEKLNKDSLIKWRSVKCFDSD